MKINYDDINLVKMETKISYRKTIENFHKERDNFWTTMYWRTWYDKNQSNNKTVSRLIAASQDKYSKRRETLRKANKTKTSYKGHQNSRKNNQTKNP